MVPTPRFASLGVAAELRALARLPGRLLVERRAHRVLLFRGFELPGTLLALGALRADAFREVGEGNEETLDLDLHDLLYWHVVVWNQEDGEIVGAYRLAEATQRGRTPDGEKLYTAELFDYQPAFFQAVGPAVELGRAFVQPRYQRSPEPLYLLWQGIGRFLSLNPDYRHLFGAVSISKLYSPQSVQLMLGFLQHRRFGCAERNGGSLSFVGAARARRPVAVEAWDGAEPVDVAAHLREVEAQVRQLEGGARGVPVLIQRYLDMGGHFLAYHEDQAFNSVACLVVLSVDRMDPRVTARFMGREAAAAYAAHGPTRRDWLDRPASRRS